MTERRTESEVDRSVRIGKAKEDMTVKVIQFNRSMDRLVKQMTSCLSSVSQGESDFIRQRELYARVKMIERALSSGMSLIRKNRLQLYMISDGDLETE